MRGLHLVALGATLRALLRDPPERTKEILAQDDDTLRDEARRGICDVEHGAVERPLGEDANELPGVLGAQAQERRQDADARARQDRLSDEREVVGGERPGHLDRPRRAVGLGELPRRLAARRAEEDACMVREVREVLRLAVLREVSRRGIGDRLQVADPASDERRVTQRPRTHGEIEAFAHQVDDASRQRHLDTDLRMLAHEARDDPGERPDAEVDGRRHAHDAAELGLGVRRGRGRFVDVAERARDTLVVGRAGIGEVELSGRSVEQPNPEVLLELRDGSADRGLGEAHRLSGSGEAAVVDDANEGGDAVQIHCCSFANNTSHWSPLVPPCNSQIRALNQGVLT